ncbi:22254_t:CDS:2, partial [Racocetra persica]
DIEEQLVTRGKIALVEYQERKFLAEVKEEDSNLLNKYDQVTLTLLDNKKIELKSNKETYPYKYVVFENNKDNKAYMLRINYFIQQMVSEVEKMARDAFLCERKLIFIVPEQPDEEDAEYLIKIRRPGKLGGGEAAEMEKYLGIRHDPLVQKQERASIAEVNASTSSFDAFERRGFRSRVKGIKEYIKVFENSKGTCEFDCDSCGYSTIETKQESKWNGEMRDGYRIVPKKILGNTGNRKGRDAVARAEVEYCENR